MTFAPHEQPLGREPHVPFAPHYKQALGTDPHVTFASYKQALNMDPDATPAPNQATLNLASQTNLHHIFPTSIPSIRKDYIKHRP